MMPPRSAWDIDSDEPLKNPAAISLEFEHRCYRRLTLAVTDAISRLVRPPLDKAIEILTRSWQKAEGNPVGKSVDNPVEKLLKIVWIPYARANQGSLKNPYMSL
jgi:hypothetical protein